MKTVKDSMLIRGSIDAIWKDGSNEPLFERLASTVQKWEQKYEKNQIKSTNFSKIAIVGSEILLLFENG